MDERPHHPVLLKEALEALELHQGGIYVDGTFGRGGHARGILERIGPLGRLLALDRDPQAVATARSLFGNDARFEVVRGRYSMMGQAIADRGWTGKVNGILLDLGVSSPQLDEPLRGFSFRHDGPLDMRMDPDHGITARQWLASAPESEIARVIRDLGEERFARRIARAICAERVRQPIETTVHLARIVADAVRTREPGQDPATRTFQAIRLHVNGELDELRAVLPQTVEAMAPGGRLVVISFHSLEEHIVKDFMRTEAKGDRFPPDLPVPAAMLTPRLRSVGRPVRPGDDELARNPRARSAVMRVAEVLGG